MKTVAQKYNDKVYEIMPHMAPNLVVDSAMDSASDIDDLVYRRSEYLGGMCAVILELVAKGAKK